jgi:hypothetical protein
MQSFLAVRACQATNAYFYREILHRINSHQSLVWIMVIFHCGRHQLYWPGHL